MRGRQFGDVLTAPEPRYQVGRTVRAEFVGAYPNNDLRHGDSYLRVEREVDSRWVRVADDGDWSTVFRWRRTGRRSSVVAVTWTVPEDAAPGRYRLRYDGNARDTENRMRAFTGTTQPFEVFR